MNPGMRLLISVRLAARGRSSGAAGSQEEGGENRKSRGNPSSDQPHLLTTLVVGCRWGMDAARPGALTARELLST